MRRPHRGGLGPPVSRGRLPRRGAGFTQCGCGCDLGDRPDRRHPQFPDRNPRSGASLVGLVVAGELVLGIIYHPLAGELYSARSGGGAFLNGQRIKVSGETDLTRARVCVGFSYRRSVEEHVRAVQALLSAGCEYLRLGSGALGLAYTAAGRFDGYWERHINSWDAAAGLVLVREAGGRANDFLAGEGLTQGSEILAATPALFEPLKPLTGFGRPG